MMRSFGSSTYTQSSLTKKTHGNFLAFCSVVFMAFWPCFPGIGMDYRKLLADASCELVEQVISFRELFERRHALFLYV